MLLFNCWTSSTYQLYKLMIGQCCVASLFCCFQTYILPQSVFLLSLWKEVITDTSGHLHHPLPTATCFTGTHTPHERILYIFMPPHQQQLWSEVLCFCIVCPSVHPILISMISQKHLEIIPINLQQMFTWTSKMNWLEFGSQKSKVKGQGLCDCTKHA